MKRTTLSLAALLLCSTTPSYAQMVTVTGTIADSVTGDPVAGAMVYVINGSKTQTDKAGRFRLKNVDLARDIMSIRKLGYAPRANRFGGKAASAEIEIGTLTLTPLAYALDSITFEAQQVADNGRLADFFRRRKGGNGWFVTQQQVFARNPITATDILRAAPGVEITCENGPCVPASRRRGTLTGAGVLCDMQIVLDGMPVSMTLDDIPPAWIAGIEVYRSSAESPVEFGTTGKNRSGPAVGLGGVAKGAVTPANQYCGSVVVWTMPTRQ